MILDLKGLETFEVEIRTFSPPLEKHNTMENNQLNIIERYLNGDLQGPELEGFEFRLDSDPELAEEVEKQRQAMLATEAFFQEKMTRDMMIKGRQLLKQQKHRPASEEETREKVVALKPRSSMRRRLNWLAAAASVLIILSVAGWQFGWFGNQPDPVAVINSYYNPEEIANSGLLSGNTEEETLRQALIDFQTANYQEALLGFNDLLSDPSFPQKPRVLLLTGIALTQIGETDQAIQRFGEIPSSARTYYLEAQWQKAFTAWKAGNEVAALEAWSSIAEDSSHPRQNDAREIMKHFNNK